MIRTYQKKTVCHLDETATTGTANPSDNNLVRYLTCDFYVQVILDSYHNPYLKSMGYKEMCLR
jgi:hypothetical protein